MTWDVIVVGARCGGAPTAMLLARLGYRVLLVDRARFPKDTLSTLYIHQPGVALLSRWGVLDAVTATGCPPIGHVRYEVAGVRLEGCSWPVEGERVGYAPRRWLLDQILANAAVDAGAEFRDGWAVDGLVFDDGRVVGVRRGATIERARLVVGADGMRSAVAISIGAPMLVEDPLMTCVYYSFWSGVSAGFELYGVTDGWAGSVPTNEGLTLVAAYFPQSQFNEVRMDAMQAYLAKLRTTAPDLAGRLESGSQEDRLYGTGDQRNFFRQPVGPGWVLVGDAAHHRDSITAQGITNAFGQAQLLADCLIEGVSDSALRRYAEGLPTLLADSYGETLLAARLRPLAQLRVVRAAAENPMLAECFFATLAGAARARDLISMMRT